MNNYKKNIQLCEKRCQRGYEYREKACDEADGRGKWEDKREYQVSEKRRRERQMYLAKRQWVKTL